MHEGTGSTNIVAQGGGWRGGGGIHERHNRSRDCYKHVARQLPKRSVTGMLLSNDKETQQESAVLVFAPTFFVCIFSRHQGVAVPDNAAVLNVVASMSECTFLRWAIWSEMPPQVHAAVPTDTLRHLDQRKHRLCGCVASPK